MQIRAARLPGYRSSTPFASARGAAAAVAAVLSAGALFASSAGADPTVPRAPPPSARSSGEGSAASIARAAPALHPNPHLKLSYRRFALSNLDGSSLWADGAQLDAYPLSRRYVRVGIELEAGAASATLDARRASASFGLGGMSLGFQVPARVTPFLDARLAAGVLSVGLDGPLAVSGAPGVTIAAPSATTWMYVGGLEAGAEIYTVGRLYLSAALGWTRSTYHGVDYEGFKRNPEAGMRARDLTSDSVSLKLGIGI